jgi:hypothetical protein
MPFVPDLKSPIKPAKIEPPKPGEVSADLPFKEKVYEYLTEEPAPREEIDLGQTGTAAGLTGAISAAAPKALQYGGGLVKRLPGAPAKFVGGGMEVLGKALGTVPLSKRIVGGTAGGAATDITGQAGEMMGLPKAVTIPAEFAAGGTVALAVSKAENALGLRAGSLSKKLREEGIEKTKEYMQSLGVAKDKVEQELQKVLSAIDAEKGKAQKELGRAQRVQRQLSEREQIATQRAGERQAITPEISAKQAVADKTRQASALAMRNAQSAKIPVQDAQVLSDDAGKLVSNAKNAADQLEQQMVNQPGIAKEQFGKLVQDTSKKLQEDGIKNRKRIAGIDKVIAEKANQISVPTKPVDMKINAILADTKDPNIRTFLTTVQKELKNEKTYGLTLKQADTLKKYIDDFVDSKEFGVSGKQSALKTAGLKVKDSIEKQMQIHNKDYFDALNRWREMSRPLDIVERNGALKKVIAQDPMSRDYLLAEAQVVGHVIDKANAGHPVFTRLIQENPAIKDTARLYYTQELFGGDTAPTISSLATFLKKNESSLKQLGLYNEFANLRSAQKAAQDAVNYANRAESEAQAGLKAAEKEASQAGKEAKAKLSLAGKAESRLGESLKTSEPLEDILKRSAARAKPAETKTAQQISNIERRLSDLDKEAAQAVGKAAKNAESQAAIEKEFGSLLNDLQKPVTKDRDVPNMVNKLADRLLDLNHISQDERNKLVNLAAKNSDLFTDTSTARRVLAGMAISIGVPYLGLKFYDPRSAAGQ